jgi:very-short-patch-repair endonuclease
LQRLCRERLPQDWVKRAALTIGTVHALQGDERDLVLFSTCLAEGAPASVGRFLGRSENLVNVACSRGRHGFLALGHRGAAQTSGVRSIEAMVDYAEEREATAAEAALAQASADTVGPGEGRLLVGLEKQGLRPLPQHPIGAYKVDLALAWRDGGLVVEVDGRHGHRDAAGEVILDDRIRDRALTNMGWAVVRVAHSDVMEAPDACAARIARRFDELRRGSAGQVQRG